MIGERSKFIVKHFLRKTARPAFFMLLLMTCHRTPVHAWEPDAHRKIVQAAIQFGRAPKELKEFLNKNAASIADSAAQPDTDEKPGVGCHSVKTCRSKINGLVRRVLSNKRSKIVAENFGRLSHYLADINHPMASRELEPSQSKLYQDYERARSEKMDIRYSAGLSIPAHNEEIENYSGRQWDDPEKDFQAAARSFPSDSAAASAIRKVTQDRITASVQDTLEVWLTVWNLKNSEPLKQKIETGASPEEYADLAILYLKQGRRNEAVKILEQAASKTGPNEKLVYAQAQLHFSEKDFPRAANLCEEYLRSHPDSLILRYQLAAICDYWFRQEPGNASVKEKTKAAWNSLKGSRYDSAARSKLEKLK